MAKKRGTSSVGEGSSAGSPGDLTDQELRRVAGAFAKTYRVAAAAKAAGVAPARCAHLPDRADFRRLVDRYVSERVARAEGTAARRRALAEYEKLAFADVEDGCVKPADKIRALSEYLRLSGGDEGGGEEAGSRLTVVYGYEGEGGGG